RSAAPIYYSLPSDELEIDENAFRALYGHELPSNRRLPDEAFTINSTASEVRRTFIGRLLYSRVRGSIRQTLGAGEDETINKMADRMIADLPLRNLVLFSNGQISFELMHALLLMMNHKPMQGFFQLIATRLKKKPVSAE
ncbi:MAG TPA: glycosyl hydrolase, partial [Anaerolineae bacterium]